MRSTTRWSPTSSVFSIEPEGMTKFCARKVRMNRPTTSTEQMLATASKASLPPCLLIGNRQALLDGVFGCGVFFFVILSLFMSVISQQSQLVQVFTVPDP